MNMAEKDSPLRHGAARPVPARTAGQDRADELLRQSERSFRPLIEEVRDYAIFMLDPEGHVSSWTLGAQQLKGYTEKEIVGAQFSVFYPEADRKAGKPRRM